MHVLTFNRPVATAIMVYFLTRVQQPSPQLFLASPAAYLQQIRAAGGIVLYRWLEYVGSPVLTYQQAIRGARGLLLPQLHAYAFHVVSLIRLPM